MPDFSLRFPFKLRPGHEIANDGKPLAITAGFQRLVFTLDRKQAGAYVARITGFSTIQGASAFAGNMWGALANILIDRTVPFEAPFQVAAVQYLPEPTVSPQMPQLGAVHGTAHEDEAIAFPSDQRIGVFGVGTPTVSVSSPGDRFLADLAGWASVPHSAAVPSDERLRTAIELYSAAFAESSRRARFLTLVMVLEVLTDPETKHPNALILLSRWEKEVDEAFKRADSADEQDALEALKRELIFRRENSIRSRVRKLVQTTLAKDPDVTTLSKQAVDAYDKRSTLVHDGSLDERELVRASEDARVVIQRVLRAHVDSIGASIA